MEGFFTRKQTESDSQAKGKVLSCVACGLPPTCKNPKLKPTGNFKKGILNVFSCPDSLEDRKGEGYIGKHAQVLKTAYLEAGIDLEKDCVNTYAVICHSEKTPTPIQIDCCRRSLMKLIAEIKPKVIVLFGETALQSVIGNRWKKDLGSIEKWQGYSIPDQELNAWICPVFDMDFVMTADYGVETLFLQRDLKKVKELTTQPFPLYVEPEIIDISNDLSILNSLTGMVAIDYETTGLKPHKKGHQVKIAAIAVNENKSFVFEVPQEKESRKPFTKLLRNPAVSKVAHNMKFEDTWSKVALKTQVNHWAFDTMLAAHIIDNRQGVTGLKFQTYVQFGVIDYDSEISGYLYSSGKNSNEFNSIDKLMTNPQSKKELMKYCVLDSIYTYRLAKKWMKSMLGTIGESSISPMKSNFPNAYNLFHEGTLALAKAERNGLRIDMEYVERQKKRITKKIEELETQIFSSNFYKHWQHCFKGKVNLSSGDQLGKYLYDIKKIKPLALTLTGKGKTDEEALKMLDIPELNMILERTKLLKIRDTYLEGFLRETVDEYLHPFYNLNSVRTYRSSSSNPNFQNIPKRDEQAMKIIRKAIFPRPGHQLMEMDYSGIEVAIAACYHKDPTMIKYITDKHSDMHGDMAKQIFKIKNFDRKRKDHAYLRSAVKNSFVFPQFYGDYYKNCATNLCNSWLKMPIGNWKPGIGYGMETGTISDLLISSGFSCYKDFESHIQAIEKDFWQKRFPVYARWKTKHYNEYLKTGYVSLYTGFVCQGLMGKNDVINYPVQGAAFHCLFRTFTKVSERFDELGLDSRLVGQIHDALIIDVHPDELEQVYEIIHEIGTKDLREHWKWINIPLEIEAEVCPVDGSWAEKKGWKPGD